jgi:hypothetical protein
MTKQTKQPRKLPPPFTAAHRRHLAEAQRGKRRAWTQEERFQMSQRVQAALSKRKGAA